MDQEHGRAFSEAPALVQQWQKKRAATPALVVQPCEALAPFVPLCSIIPSGRAVFFFFFAATAEKQKVTFEDFKGSLTLKRPPYSCCGSKDGGYADCQLGVPMRAISSQRKIDVSKGNPEESAVL